MPNHTDNGIRVKGKVKDIQKMLREIKEMDIDEDTGKKFERPFSFNKIIPTPTNIYQGNLGQKEKAQYGEDNWYDWNIKNWGTKWNAYSGQVETNFPSNTIQYLEEDKGEAYIFFQSAWSPPEPVLDAFIKKYPEFDLEIGYMIEGNTAWGKYTYKKGKLVKESDKASTVKQFFKKYFYKNV